MNTIDDKKQKEIFSKNLIALIEKSSKMQKDIAIDIGENPTTLNNWCVGISIPKFSVVRKLANYFNVTVSQLIDEVPGENDFYYMNNEAAETAQKIFNEDKVLLDVYNSADKEKLVEYANMLKLMREKEKGD